MTQTKKALLADKLNTARALVDLAPDVDANDFQAIMNDLWRAQQTIESAQRTTAELMRAQDYSWSEIGQAFGGLTRQGAQQRWG